MHDDIEFIAVLKGEMNYSVNGEIVGLKKGEGIFVNSRQLHYGFSKTKNECEFLCILIHPVLLCVSGKMEQKYVLPLLGNQNMPYIKLSPDIPWQREVSECLYGMYEAKDDTAAPLTVCSLFMKIWSLIFADSKITMTPKERDNDFILLKNMIGYIQKSYREKITLEDIAAAGTVGQSKCCRLFDKYIGITPNAYVIRYRLHQSTWYLKNTDMSVTEVAEAVGFSGSSYYAESFRKWSGKSPSEYRRADRI